MNCMIVMLEAKTYSLIIVVKKNVNKQLSFYDVNSNTDKYIQYKHWINEIR